MGYGNSIFEPFRRIYYSFSGRSNKFCKVLAFFYLFAVIARLPTGFIILFAFCSFVQLLLLLFLLLLTYRTGSGKYFHNKIPIDVYSCCPPLALRSWAFGSLGLSSLLSFFFFWALVSCSDFRGSHNGATHTHTHTLSHRSRVRLPESNGSLTHPLTHSLTH